MPLRRILFVAGVIAASTWLMYLIDDGLGLGWPQTVVRNWQQFGIFNLHGQMVPNPGGFEATTHPQIYHGMSPVCLYPAYLATVVFGWTGLGVASFFALLALTVFWSVWRLLGRNAFAAAVAAATVLCPGYGRWLNNLDPNAISILFGLPYAAVVLLILKRPQLEMLPSFGLIILTLIFTSLNWTTAWFFGPCFAWLLAMPGINRRALFKFVGLAAASSLLFAALSVVAKRGGSHAASGAAGLGLFLRSYTWGDVGYGTGATTGKLFLRLAFVNAVGLFPLLLVWMFAGFKFWQCVRKKLGVAVSPLVLAILEIMFMRNYFGHHPWMAAPVLIVGLIFSLVLFLTTQAEKTPTDNFNVATRRTPVPLVAFSLGCFVYGLAVIVFLRANEVNNLSLLNLVRHHTARSDCIVVVKSDDPATAQLAPRLKTDLDRRVVVVDGLPDIPSAGNHCVVLSATTLNGPVKLIAKNSGPEAGRLRLLQDVAQWFNRHIARRNPGDRLNVGNTYYLYKSEP